MPRNFSKAIQISIFRRDGWMCRWCKKPVIFAPVMKLIALEVNESGFVGDLAYHHLHWSRKSAPLLDELGAVLNHVHDSSTGGPDTVENLVTACNKCNGHESAGTLRRIRGAPTQGREGQIRGAASLGWAVRVVSRAGEPFSGRAVDIG